jgi:RimJ/RimL family protein N-acetyltransferase
MSIRIATERLILRPLRRSDVPAITRALGNINVARTLNPVPHPYSEHMAHDWVASLPPNKPDLANFGVELPGIGLVGSIGLESELGYWIAEPFWGNGYATEAGAAVLRWHFTGTRSQRVQSAAHIDNPASLAVQLKLGFVRCGHKTAYSAGRGTKVDHIETVLTRDAFRRKGYLS